MKRAGGWIVKDRGELRNFAVCGWNTNLYPKRINHPILNINLRALARNYLSSGAWTKQGS
jgi:hypothetical protein